MRATSMGGGMGQSVATMLIEPRSVVREALASLLVSHSFQIVGSVASASDIDKFQTSAEQLRLVILSGLPVDEAVSVARRIRGLWPKAKSLLLFEHASLDDLQKVLASEIDGCIPVSASPNVLGETLQQIIAADFRILILKIEPCLSKSSQTTREEVSEAGPALLGRANARDVTNDCFTSLPLSCGLSQREEEILKGVIRGHSNKMIARSCGVTDATIKVHMKSILRKIRVSNRTQAAIWALERGYGAEANRRPLTLRSASQEAAVA